MFDLVTAGCGLMCLLKQAFCQLQKDEDLLLGHYWVPIVGIIIAGLAICSGLLLGLSRGLEDICVLFDKV